MVCDLGVAESVHVLKGVVINQIQQREGATLRQIIVQLILVCGEDVCLHGASVKCFSQHETNF